MIECRIKGNFCLFKQVYWGYRLSLQLETGNKLSYELTVKGLGDERLEGIQKEIE